MGIRAGEIGLQHGVRASRGVGFAEAAGGKPMTLTLADGRKFDVETQKGCAGSVTASSFDNDPDQFWRQGNARAKIPAR